MQNPDQAQHNYHGLLSCATDGNFALTTTLFHPYTVRYDGPGGDILRLLGRNAWRPAHLHVTVEARHYRALVTELFVEGDKWLELDAAFGVRAELIMRLDRSSNRSKLSAKFEPIDRLPFPIPAGDVTIRVAREPV